MAPPRTLLVFCDGTGKDGTLTSSSESDAHVSETAKSEGSHHTKYATNVLRLSRCVLPYDKNGNRQVVFYQSGVGSESDFAGDSVTGTKLMKALGTAVASKIRDAYVFLAQNFEDGDEICLFGFSRGAYTARKVAGLIDAIGLLSHHNLSHFFEIWRQLIDKEPTTKFSDTRFPDIKCVGVWDTVGSVYNEIDALNIKDTSLPAKVKVALHAVSLHENRKKFLPTLWTVPPEGLKEDQIFRQVWFPGAHSDVGGGYEHHELADISICWMAGYLERDLVNLDIAFLRSFFKFHPRPWELCQPHNAYMETTRINQYIVGHETRLESGQITAESEFHESLMFSPEELDSPEHMITMPIIEEKLGSGFQPQFIPLTGFEQYCRYHWGIGMWEGRHGIESPEIVWR